MLTCIDDNKRRYAGTELAIGAVFGVRMRITGLSARITLCYTHQLKVRRADVQLVTCHASSCLD